MTTPHRCGNCGTTWRHTDRVGCCSACKQAFASLSAFDAHQVGPRDEHGRLTCVDAATATYSDPDGKRYGERVFLAANTSATDGKGQLWRLAPSAEQAAALDRLKATRP